MLRRISEDIVFYLIRWRILDIRKQELYTYSMEVILLNSSILLSVLGISLLTDTLVHFLFFISVFCPMRMMAGGYHAKTPGKCFLFSNGLYITSIIIRYLLLDKKMAVLWLALGILSIIVIFITGPLERKGINVPEHIHNRHKKKLDELLLLDLILLLVLYILYIRYLDSVVLAILFAGLLQKAKIVMC